MHVSNFSCNEARTMMKAILCPNCLKTISHFKPQFYIMATAKSKLHFFTASFYSFSIPSAKAFLNYLHVFFTVDNMLFKPRFHMLSVLFTHCLFLG